MTLNEIALETSRADAIVICLIDLLCGHVRGIRDQEPRAEQQKYRDTSMHKADARAKTAGVNVVHVRRDELEQPSRQSLAAESE